MADNPQVCFETRQFDEPWTLDNYRKLGVWPSRTMRCQAW